MGVGVGAAIGSITLALGVGRGQAEDVLPTPPPPSLLFARIAPSCPPGFSFYVLSSEQPFLNVTSSEQPSLTASSVPLTHPAGFLHGANLSQCIMMCILVSSR